MKLKICVVPDCLSTSLNEPDLAYHKFPSCADTRRTWTERMKVVAENMRHPIPQVCSKHFRKDDYLPYHKTCKRMLKKGAAPTIFPWGIVDSPTYIPAVSQIPLKRRRRRKFIPRPAVLNNILDRDAIPVPPTDAGDLDDSIADISTENSRDISKRSEESKDSETFSSKNIFESENSDHGSVTDTSSVSFTPEKNKHQRHGHGKYALGVRLEAKDVSSNKWYKAKVVEVDWEDAEVLIHFEQWSQRFDEWIPMDSPRLRPWQNHSPRSSQTAFRVGETVMASWTDNRKYAARIKSILSGDKYEVQFFDGFVKTVKGHKISKGSDEILAMDPGLFHNAGASTMTKAERRERKRKIGPVSELFQLKKRYSDAEKSVAKKLSFDTNNANESKDAAKAVKISSSLTDRKRGSDGKSRQRAFPVIKVNLDGEKPKVTPDKKKPTVNLRDTPTLSSTSLSPMVPVRALKRRKRDDIDPSDYNNWEPEGEEAWVVESSEGLRRSIIVNDDRLPPGWNKHSIQRKSGNSAGKWDVFLVSPTGRRFRSRKEMTSYFAERGEEYQPDIFDFTLRCKMRRKNKDTEHMKEKIKKPGSKRYSRTSATSVTPPVDKVLVDDSPVPVSRRVKTLLPRSLEERGTLIEPPPPHPSSQGVLPGEPENGAESALVGNRLKIQMDSDGYVCPIEGCLKHFRKENLLQMHIKHYHPEYSKFLGSTPNVADLAYARTVGESLDEGSSKSRPFGSDFLEQITRFEARKKTKLQQGKQSAVSPAVAPAELAQLEKDLALLPKEKKELKSDLPNVSTDLETKTPSHLVDNLHMDDMEGKAIDFEDYIKPVPCSSMTPTPEFFAEKEILPTPGTGIKTLLPVVRTTVKIPPLEALDKDNQKTSAGSSLIGQLLASGSPVSPRANVLMPLQRSRMIRKRRLSDMYIETLKKRKLGKLAKSYDDTALNNRDQTPLRFPNQQPKYRYLTKKKKVSSPLSHLQLQHPPASPMDTSEPDCSPGSATLATAEEEIFEQLQKKDIINCTCGIMEEDGLMIQCDLCLCWQHVLCNSTMEEVPDKYVCYICLHPARERKSRHFVHDQYWLKEGTLPSLSFRTKDEGAIVKREARLVKSHDLTGGLLDLKEVLRSVRVKLAIAEQPDHPKLYLWAEKTASNLSTTSDSISESVHSNLKQESLVEKDGIMDSGVPRVAPDIKLQISHEKNSGVDAEKPLHEILSQSSTSGHTKRQSSVSDKHEDGTTTADSNELPHEDATAAGSSSNSNTMAVQDHTYVHLTSMDKKDSKKEISADEHFDKLLGCTEPREKVSSTESLKLDPEMLADALTSNVLPDTDLITGSNTDLHTVLGTGLSSGEHHEINTDLNTGLMENPGLCPSANTTLNADLSPGLNIGNPLDATAQSQLLQFPICRSELMRFASSMADNLKETGIDSHPTLPVPTVPQTPMAPQAPQPEKPIDPIECRLNLLDHIEDYQNQIGSRLSSIDEQISLLEKETPDPIAEETTDFYPQTKHTIQMLIRDLTTMKKLALSATGYTLIKH